MSKAESTAWPEEQPGDDNVVAFGRPEPESSEPDEFEVSILHGLFNEDNVRFLLERAKETGEDLRVILNIAVESYAGLYELYEEGRPLFYLGTDKKMHQIDDGTKPLEAS